MLALSKLDMAWIVAFLSEFLLCRKQESRIELKANPTFASYDANNSLALF
jgi:hypothetical protein